MAVTAPPKAKLPRSPGPKKEKPGGKVMRTAPPGGTALKTRKLMVASVSAPVVGLSRETFGCVSALFSMGSCVALAAAGRSRSTVFFSAVVVYSSKEAVFCCQHGMTRPKKRTVISAPAPASGCELGLGLG